MPDDTILRLVDLLDGLPDEDVLDLVEALSRLSPDRRPPRDEADVGSRPDASAAERPRRRRVHAGAADARVRTRAVR